jgi:hypothetical protein
MHTHEGVRFQVPNGGDLVGILLTLTAMALVMGLRISPWWAIAALTLGGIGTGILHELWAKWKGGR